MAGYTALVLDEDKVARRFMVERLRDEGFETVTCSERERVKETVEAHRVDICVISSRVTVGDGIELVRELRHNKAPGLIVLGHSSEELDVVLALEMGADDYLAKPVRPRELCARARSVLRRTIVTRLENSGARPLPEHPVRVLGDLEISGITRTVHRAGEPIDLTATEFDVLMVLSSSTNAVLSREFILQAARGSGWSAGERFVDGIVSRLRRKLFEGDEGARRIKTVHGRGYMMVVDE